MNCPANAEVAAFFRTLFAKTGMKLDAQVLATALAVYVTDVDLAGGYYGSRYGFTVKTSGVAADLFNIGNTAAAFNAANFSTVSNGALLTVMDILKRANARAVNGVLWNGVWTYQVMGNLVFTGINETGDIA